MDRSAPPSAAVDAEKLASFIERIEALEQEKAEVADQIKEVYKEAKEGANLCPKTMKAMVTLRKKSAADRQADLFMFDLYADALSMRAGPIGSEVRESVRKLREVGASVKVGDGEFRKI